MPNNWLTKNNLALLLGILLGLKFILLPLKDWQAVKLSELMSKSRQLGKIDQVLAAEETYQDHARQLKTGLEGSRGYFYSDDSSTKLVIQRNVEEIFDRSGLNVTGFTWSLDSLDTSGSFRVLRASVYFTGATTAMIEAFWGLAVSARLNKVVEFSQQIRRSGENTLGVATGNVTLEFFAAKADSSATVAMVGQSFE